jgi:hypothetical protein
VIEIPLETATGETKAETHHAYSASLSADHEQDSEILGQGKHPLQAGLRHSEGILLEVGLRDYGGIQWVDGLRDGVFLFRDGQVRSRLDGTFLSWVDLQTGIFPSWVCLRDGTCLSLVCLRDDDLG